jgi:hypothetical protein
MPLKSQKTAKSVLAAFKSLSKAERDSVIVGLAKDRALRRDLIDLAICEVRAEEPTRPFREFLAELRRK